MATTTQVTDFSDLYTDLLNRVRQSTSVTATVNQAKRFINTALFDMHIGQGERFPWAERRAFIRTVPSYSEGTAAVTAGSAIIGGSGTEWNGTRDTSDDPPVGASFTRAGGKIRFESEDEIYEVSAVNSDTQITLTQNYARSTNFTASYTYYEDEYALASDFLRPIDYRRFTDGPIQIAIVGRRDFYRIVGQNFTLNRPRYATLIDLSHGSDTTPVRKVVFYPAPDKFYQIPYRYVTSNLAVDSSGNEQTQLVNDTDEPIVPLRYRHVLVFHALYQWYRDKKNDTRSQEAQAEYADLVRRITADHEIGEQKAAINPAVMSYRSRSRRPWSGGRRLGRFDVNGAFDRLEDL